MHISSRSYRYSLVLLLSVVVSCSDPQLYNPNDPHDIHFVDVDLLSRDISIYTVPNGIHFILPAKPDTILGYQIERTPADSQEDTLVIQVPPVLSDREVFEFTDTNVVWTKSYQYAIRSKTRSGLTREISDTLIAFSISTIPKFYGGNTDQDANRAQLLLPLAAGDSALGLTGQLISSNPTDTTLVSTSLSNDSLAFTIPDLMWGSTYAYKLRLRTSFNDSIYSDDFLYYIRPAPLSVALQFMGSGKIRLQLSVIETESNDLNTPDTLWILPALIDSFIINFNYQSQFFYTTDDLPWTIILEVPPNADSLVLSDINLAFSDSTADQRFQAPLSSFLSYPIPGAIEKMVLVEPQNNQPAKFYMDKYEITQDLWNLRTGSDSAKTWMDEWAAEWVIDIPDSLLPVGGIGRERIRQYFESDTSRRVPTWEEWQAAGGGTVYPNGYEFLSSTACNYFDSGDNYEGNAYPAVPVDFFTNPDNSSYTVNGSTPTVDMNPYGLTQMSGNLFEWVWVALDSDTVVTGGSFWSASDDPLLRGDSYLAPNQTPTGNNRSFGLRTVLKDTSLSSAPYFYELIF